MTATIISKFFWNINYYCHIRYGDGTTIELSSNTEKTDEEWITLALDMFNNRLAEPDPMRAILMSCPDSMLVEEVLRRHLNITVEGGQV